MRKAVARAGATPAPRARRAPADELPDPDGSSTLDAAREDAARIVRNRTYGIVDPTLDPVDVLAEILGSEADLYTREQMSEQRAELESACAEREEERKLADQERVKAEAARERAEGLLEQAQADLAELRAELEIARAAKQHVRCVSARNEGEESWS